MAVVEHFIRQRAAELHRTSAVHRRRKMYLARKAFADPGFRFRISAPVQIEYNPLASGHCFGAGSRRRRQTQKGQFALQPARFSGSLSALRAPAGAVCPVLDVGDDGCSGIRQVFRPRDPGSEETILKRGR
jgi:hypothetical protein